MVSEGDRFCRALHPDAWAVVRAGLIVLLTCLRVWSADSECKAALAAYNGYTVVDVQLRDPIGFITPFSPLDKSLREGLKLKKGGTFSNQSFEEDSQKLNDTLTAQFASSSMKVKFSYAGGKIVDCIRSEEERRVGKECRSRW